MAEIEINIGTALKSLEFVDEALKLENEMQSIFNLGEIYKIKGMVYHKLNEHSKAEEHFHISLNYSDKTNNIYEKCSTMIKLASLLIETGRKDEAIDLLQKVAEICMNKRFNVLLKESYHLLYTVHKELNNSDESLLYLEKYIEIDDQIYDYEQNQLMAKMNLKHTKREAKLYKNLYDKTELLSSIGQKVISNLNINSIIEIIHREINKLFNCNCFGVAVYESEKNEALYQLINENSVIREITFNIEDDMSFISYCIKNKKDIIISNAEVEYDKYEIANSKCVSICKNQKSMIFTPMIIKDKVVGLMSVLSNKKNAYDKNDLHTLKILANYSAIAIDNAMNYKKVEIKAIYDQMTGFLTKYEVIRLGQILYEKYKENKINFSIIMIDIDDFKIVNDTYGHYYGDKALSLISQTISKCIRASDYIGRYGGDEFLLICPGAKQKEAMEVAERIRKTVYNKSFDLGDDITVNLSLSLGVYEFSYIDESFTDGMKMADKQMYSAKRNDKNKVVSI